MRIRASLLALLLISACATAPATAPSATPQAAAAASGPSRTLQLLRSAGQDNAPTRADIERTLGAPDVARQDGAGAALTYRLESCALLMVFVADGRNTFRLAEAHAGPRRAGDASPSLEQCAAEAAQR